MIWTPIVSIRLAQALAAIQTLKDWEEQQDDSIQQAAKQLKDHEMRARALQLLSSKQTTQLGRTHHEISSFPRRKGSPDVNV